MENQKVLVKYVIGCALCSGKYQFVELFYKIIIETNFFDWNVNAIQSDLQVNWAINWFRESYLFDVIINSKIKRYGNIINLNWKSLYVTKNTHNCLFLHLYKKNWFIQKCKKKWKIWIMSREVDCFF